MTDMITFEPKHQPAYIKVIGVGGGGSNAVNHMYAQGIQGVEFLVCNTDVQALQSSPVPVKIALGNRVLGAGSKPEVGRTAATESIDKITEALTEETQMVFITAGMGGGTGTGAAPIIAEQSKKAGILTVGIVTLPFLWEGRRRRQQAEAGINEMRKHVDSLIVISNDKLREVYGDLSVSHAFAKADNVLTSAAKGIAEIITVPGYVNVDFEDVKTVMLNSGKAIMGSAVAEGEGRALQAIENAMSSPLLNDNEIKGAQNILLYIMTGNADLTMDEITEITDYIHQESGGDHEADIIWGNGTDETLDQNISVTIIATGFDSKPRGGERKPKKIYTLDDSPEVEKEQKEETNRPEAIIEKFESVRHKEEVADKKVKEKEPEEVLPHRIPEIKITDAAEKFDEPEEPEPQHGPRIVHTLDEITIDEVNKKVNEVKDTKEEEPPQEKDKNVFFGKTSQPGLAIGHTVSTSFAPSEKKRSDADDDMAERSSKDRSAKLRALSRNFNTEYSQEELESVPAFKRKNIELEENKPSEDSNVSRYTLGEDSKKNPNIQSGNSFLHDNVD
jgi:cell division protein FtsZ